MDGPWHNICLSSQHAHSDIIARKSPWFFGHFSTYSSDIICAATPRLLVWSRRNKTKFEADGETDANSGEKSQPKATERFTRFLGLYGNMASVNNIVLTGLISGLIVDTPASFATQLNGKSGSGEKYAFIKTCVDLFKSQIIFSLLVLYSISHS